MSVLVPVVCPLIVARVRLPVYLLGVFCYNRRKGFLVRGQDSLLIILCLWLTQKGGEFKVPRPTRTRHPPHHSLGSFSRLLTPLHLISFAGGRPAAFVWGCLPCFAGTPCLRLGSQQQGSTWLPLRAPLIGSDRHRRRRARSPRKPRKPQPPPLGALGITILPHGAPRTGFPRLRGTAAEMWTCAHGQQQGENSKNHRCRCR